MARAVRISSFAILIGLLITVGVLAGSVQAGTLPAADMDLVQGALLYDKWYAALGIQPPAGEHPLWLRQSTNTRSGPDTWRCVECHGWDYKGKDGSGHIVIQLERMCCDFHNVDDEKQTTEHKEKFAEKTCLQIAMRRKNMFFNH